MCITDNLGLLVSAASIGNSFEKYFFFTIEVYLFIEPQVSQVGIISFDRLIWNRKTFKTENLIVSALW